MTEREALRRRWTWLFDSYEDGTVFITDDPEDEQEPIAEGLSEKAARRIVEAHNAVILSFDPEVLALWDDYLHVTATGNPFGLTFAQYIAARQEPPEPTVSNSTGITLATPAAPELDEELLAQAMYEHMRATYRDARRAPPPWDRLRQPGEWKPQGGVHRTTHRGIRDQWLEQARELAAAARKPE